MRYVHILIALVLFPSLLFAGQGMYPVPMAYQGGGAPVACTLADSWDTGGSYAIVGRYTSNKYTAIAFIPTETEDLTKLTLNLRRYGATANLTFRVDVREDDANKPSTSPPYLDSASNDFADISDTGYTSTDFYFDGASLTSGTIYWLVLSVELSGVPNVSDSDYVVAQYDTDGLEADVDLMLSSDDQSWADAVYTVRALMDWYYGDCVE